MPKITESDLKKQIKNNNLSNFYLIYGSEKFLINYYEKLLVESIVEKKQSSFNYNLFDKDDIDINLLKTCIETFPINSDKKCVLIKNLNLDGMNAKQITDICEIITDIPDTCTLLIIQTTIEVNEKKSSKWKKFITHVSKFGNIIEINQKTQTSLEKQIISWAKKRDKILSSENASRILSMCGKNLNDLKNEIEKLCALESESEIKLSTIDNIVTKNLESNVFELCKLLIAGDIAKAYECLGVLFFQREEPIMILSAIASNYIDMYRVKVAIESGQSPTAVSSIFDYKGKDFKIKNAERNLRYMSLNQIRQSIYLLLETDVKLKSSRVDARIILEEMIVKLIKIRRNDIN